VDPSLKEAIPAISNFVVYLLVIFLFMSAPVLLIYQLWNLFFPQTRLVYGHLEGLKGFYILQRSNPGDGSGVLSRLVQESPISWRWNLKVLRKLEQPPDLSWQLFLVGIVILVLGFLSDAETKREIWVVAGVSFLYFSRDIWGRFFHLISNRKSGTDTIIHPPLEPPKADIAEMKRFRFIPKHLLAALEIKNGKLNINFQGYFIVHGSTILAATNEERGLLNDPRDLRDFCIFFGNKMTFASAVLGMILWLALMVPPGIWRGLLRGSPVWAALGHILPFPVLALVFWFCLGWLRFTRLSRAMRSLIEELSRQPYYEPRYGQVGGESAFEWKTLAAVIGLFFSVWLTWRLLAGL